MTTRLSQRKIKGGDPAYQTLKDELEARTLGSGTGGYTVPVGGIPRSDMTQDVRDALALAESAYVIPDTGIPTSDLDTNVRAALVKANTAYQKPVDGIGIIDLEQTIQDRLNDFSTFYIYPPTGIPYVDMDMNVQSLLNKAETAYQKPETGIPKTDMDSGVKASLGKADSAYQKPATGIPASDLKDTYVTPNELIPFQEHMGNAGIHITDHANLTGIGEYTHDELDKSINDHQDLISQMRKELLDARDVYASLGARIDAAIGKNTIYEIDRKEDWLRGTFQNLIVNNEGNVSFSFQPQRITLDLFDISEHNAFLDENRIGGITLDKDTYVNMGTRWVNGGTTLKSYDNFVGLRFKGYVFAPDTGEYRFSVQFSGRARIQVAGQLLFDSGGVYAYDYGVRSDTITLEGGRLYPIVIEAWYYTEGERIFGLQWKPPGQSVDYYIPMQYLNYSGYKTTTGTYESPVIDLYDDQISTWYLVTEATEYRADDDILAEVSVSDDNVTFSEWIPTPTVGEIPVTPARFVKVRLTIIKNYAQYTPLLHRFYIRYISSAQNAYIDEIIQARDAYLDLKDRFDAIDSQLISLGDFYDQIDTAQLHPEFFASVRLAEIELNMLRHLIIETASLADYQLLEDGFIDHFKTMNFIDQERSGDIELFQESIRQQQNITTFDVDADWAKFELDRLDYSSGNLRLAFLNKSASGASTVFSNDYNWSYSNPESLIGYNYSGELAQPFYTSENTGRIKRVQFRVATTNYTAYAYFMICPTAADGNPDISNPIWKSAGYNVANATTYNFDNIYAYVVPNRKYWLVVQLYSWNNTSAYSYFWITPNNSNTNARLRGTNPGKETLFIWTKRYGTNSWAQSGSYFLTFYMEETVGYELEGTGKYVIDYGETTRFLSQTLEKTITSDGTLSVEYLASDDQQVWTGPKFNPEELPPSRFLQISVRMKRSSNQGDSPSIQRLRIGHVDESIEVISKPFEAYRIPTHAIALIDDNNTGHIDYFISRDDGKTWKEIVLNTHIDLSGIRPGRKIRLKAVLKGDHPDSRIYNWGVLGISQRDITGQNITALFEEYISGDGQTDFVLENPYPMGNNALQVYLNGIYQSIEKDYTEIDNHTIRFNEPLVGGLDADRVTFRVSAGAWDLHDVKLSHRINALEQLMDEDIIDHDVTYEYNENNKVAKEIYTGGVYHTKEYRYDDKGRREFMIETRDRRMTMVQYIYDEENRILQKRVTHSEVTE